MRLLMLVALGGAIGSAARHMVNLGAARAFGLTFPWGTLIVNVAGSLAMGLLIEWIVARHAASPDLRALLLTGVLGGFTTFSAFSLDFALLVERKAHLAALLYLGTSVGVSIAAVLAGIATARALLA